MLMRQRGLCSQKMKRELSKGMDKGKKIDQNGAVLELVEPGQNRFNRSGSRFLWLNRWFPVFGLFFYFSGFSENRIGLDIGPRLNRPVRSCF